MSSNDQYRLSIHNYQAVAPDRIYDLQSFQQIYLFNENFWDDIHMNPWRSVFRL